MHVCNETELKTNLCPNGRTRGLVVFTVACYTHMKAFNLLLSVAA